MKQFLLYGHGGAYNHGAEAIIKCTVNMIRQRYPDSKIILSTHFKDQDIEFDMPVDEYCQRDPKYLELDSNSQKKGIYDKSIYKSTLEKITSDMVCLSVGGDNYCYDNWRRWKTVHEAALERGALSVLWSCSIEPSMIDNEMLEVLSSHHLITARESITYNTLKNKGLDNVKQCPDIAFLLEPKEYPLPNNFLIGNTVALNISPLIVRREKTAGILQKNADILINYIIKNTDMNIALIPHVLMSMDNDLSILKKIYSESQNKERVCLIDENISAAEYKYIISKCRFGVFARTHASISAYSTYIPSIVIGYSVKSKGIADDLGLGNFVLPVQNLNDGHCLLSMFKNLSDSEQKVKQALLDIMPAYKERAKTVI